MSAESMDAARLLAAAMIATRWPAADPHQVAHEVLQLEDELRRAQKCKPPDGSYRADDCSYGWIAGEQ